MSGGRGEGKGKGKGVAPHGNRIVFTLSLMQCLGFLTEASLPITFQYLGREGVVVWGEERGGGREGRERMKMKGAL